MRIGYCISLEELRQLEPGMAEFVDLSGCELAALSISEIHKIAARLKVLDIECVGIHAAFPDEIKIAGKNTDESACLDYFMELVKRAKILQTKFIGIGSPSSRMLEPGEERTCADRRFAALLRRFSDYIDNMLILVESVNRRETNYINLLEEAYDIVLKADRDNIALVLDLYHFLMEKEDIKNISNDMWEKIWYIHIADPQERKYPGYSTNEQLKLCFQKASQRAGNVCETAIEGNTTMFLRDVRECNEVMRMWCCNLQAEL